MDTDKDTALSPWLTIDQAARYLQVSEGTVRNWIYKRYIPHVKRGRVVRLHTGELDDWLRRRAAGRAGAAGEAAVNRPDTGKEVL